MFYPPALSGVVGPQTQIVYLPGEPGDVLRLLRACRRWCIMSTYEELQLIVSVALLILAILTYTHKK